GLLRRVGFLQDAYSTAIKGQGNSGQRQDYESDKPPSAPEGRQHNDFNRRTLVVPHSIAISSQNREAIFAGWQMRIIGCAARGCVNPVLVQPFESVFELHQLRVDKTQARIMYLHIDLAG